MGTATSNRVFALLFLLTQLLGVKSVLGAAPGIAMVSRLGGTYGEAYDINIAGEVVGLSYLTTGTAAHAFKYSGFQNGTISDLGTLGGLHSAGNGINDAGEVVGYAYPAGATRNVAFKFSGGQMFELGSLGGPRSVANEINETGQVVGYAFLTDNSTYHAFWHPGTSTGAMIDLGTLGGTLSQAIDINDRGEIVGWAMDSLGNTRAFKRLTAIGESMSELGTLGGSSSGATSINNSGVVVGGSYLAGDRISHAFRQSGSSSATMIDLGGLGGPLSGATDINDAGIVVGYAYLNSSLQHATLWTADNTLFDLDTWLNAANPTLGAYWTLTSAQAINSSGLVTGIGTYSDGPGGLPDGTQGFLLDASSLIPEPSMMTLALVCLFASRRALSRRTTTRVIVNIEPARFAG